MGVRGETPAAHSRQPAAVMMVASAGVRQSAGASDPGEREFVQVVRFGVTYDNQSKLIQMISDEVERWVRACPGFIACHMHASRDGKYVLNYARWQTEAAFRDFTNHAEIAALNAAIRSCGPTGGPEPASYQLVRCIVAISSGVQTEPSMAQATS